MTGFASQTNLDRTRSGAIGRLGSEITHAQYIPGREHHAVVLFPCGMDGVDHDAKVNILWKSDQAISVGFSSDKNIEGPANGNLKDIHAYARGNLNSISRDLSGSIVYLENTDNPNSPHAQRVLRSEPKTWQESLYKFYFRANRVYKQITYYAWRFAELHSYKLVLFIMVLVAVLRVSRPISPRAYSSTSRIGLCF